MAMSDYREEFPGSVVQRMSQKQREKMDKTWKSKSRIEKMLLHRSYPSEIKHWTNKGLSEDEAKIKVSEFQQRASLCQNNEKTREKKSKLCSGPSNPMSIESIANRHGVSIEEARRLTPAYNRKGTLHPLFGKSHTIEAREKIARNVPQTRFNRSKAEDELAGELRSLGLQIVQNVGILTYNVDILVGDNFIVEYYGDLWHCNPHKYSSEDHVKMIGMKARERWDIDAKRCENLLAAGYNLIVVWESDWKSDRQTQITRVTNATNYLL